MLNPHEKIDSWDVVVTTKVDEETAAHIPARLRSRKLAAMGDLGIELPDTATKQIDTAIEAMYPVTWND